MAHKHSDSFPLLIYQTLAHRWQGPSFWLIPGGMALWWAARRGTLLDSRHAWLALLISVSGLILTLYNLLARRAVVRCYKDHFTLQTPLYPVAFSYRRIEAIRPIDFHILFPPAQEKASRQHIYQNLWGKTAIAVDLNSYPISLKWLRLWVSPYLFNPKTKGLVLLVDDWMGLVRRLETRRTEWLNNYNRRRR